MAPGIVFQRDERWVDKDQMMAFTAEVMGRSVPCFVSDDVLKVHFLSNRLGRFQAFRENRKQIEGVAAQCLEAGLPELHLTLSHFTQADDYIPWE